jgi:hypothetical protein
MLSPLDALSVAAAVVQFVDFGVEIISAAREISESATGDTKQNATMQLSVSAFEDLSRTVMASSSNDIETQYPKLFWLAKVCEKEVYVPIRRADPPRITTSIK